MTALSMVRRGRVCAKTPKTGYFRDLALLRLGRQTLVAACDAVGGLGSKPEDFLLMEPESVGYFSARVVLLELLSVEVKPLLAICTLSVEREPTGRRLMIGVRTQLREALHKDISIIDSVETNFPTRHTAMGIALLGKLSKGRRLGGKVQLGDEVYRIGTPRTGIKIGDADILAVDIVRRLVARRQVHEVIPLGSRGVRSELSDLRTRGIDVTVGTEVEAWELTRSGGPANAVLAVVSSRWRQEAALAQLFDGAPALKIGTVTGAAQQLQSPYDQRNQR